MMGPMYNPYAPLPPQSPWGPPPPQLGSPPVWPWYIAYAVAMALMYLMVAASGGFLLAAGENIEDQIQGGVMAVMGLGLAAVFGVAPLLPKKPWAWVYHVVLIGLSMTSFCCMPISIPLLIHWLKPETKAFFGRS
jgi:hypothetical protein